MNPGKLVDAPKMDDTRILRFGPDYSAPLDPNTTVFSYTADMGFARAVEMCNGAGVCRKLEQGVMCPSFMATLDEAHSTRGRANALRAAMMGLLGPDGMTSRQVYEVMDLCLSCKACKSECPSSVDMAKLKAEFLHGYYQEHGTPLRSRLFANIAKLNRLGRIAAPLTNVLLRGPVKWAMTFLGVHPDRPLPLLAPQSFTAWWKRHASGRQLSMQNSVVLFNDTFMEHNNPEIGRAAVKVLEAAGFHVVVVEKHECCGRPAVSKGLLDEAARMARANVALLAPYAKQDIPIVGCEPSCIAMLVDEYPQLVPGDDALAVARHALLLDDFLAQEAQEGRLNLAFDETPRKVLLHGHCNQKALFGTAGTHAMLKLIPYLTVQEVDSSCCGMAGSFGYEKEHFDLSMKLVEMNLAPAVRAASAETIIAATGTSCREQIHHATDRPPKHPIEVLAEALVDGR
jgi:Fe-S oxidoreductase